MEMILMKLNFGRRTDIASNKIEFLNNSTSKASICTARLVSKVHYSGVFHFWGFRLWWGGNGVFAGFFARKLLSLFSVFAVLAFYVVGLLLLRLLLYFILRDRDNRIAICVRIPVNNLPYFLVFKHPTNFLKAKEYR